jgi:hypothetical protein
MHFAQDNAVTVSGGALHLNVAAGSTVGAGVTVSIATGATLDLAGATSALSPAGLTGSDRPLIKNDGTLSLTAFQTAQVVGGIDNGSAGTGVTSVAAGTSLTADHIIQAALIIGGDQDFGALVTISPSDDIGNPLVAEPPVGTSDPLGVGAAALGQSTGAISVDSGTAVGFDGGVNRGTSFISSPLGRTAIGGGATVPEPASLLLLLSGACIVAVAARQSRRQLFRMHLDNWRRGRKGGTYVVSKRDDRSGGPLRLSRRIVPSAGEASPHAASR